MIDSRWRSRPSRAATVDLLDAARAGDADAFRAVVDCHRAELHAHCYRMLRSEHDAEDAFQETVLRTWRGLAGLEDGRRLRPWLYKIATNACLDAIRARQRRALPIDCAASAGSNETGESLQASRRVERDGNVWLGNPDRDATPEARYERREGVELAFVTALQHLPDRQRAVFILREVLGFSAREVSELLETTVPAVNSAQQRARKSVDTRRPEHGRQRALPSFGSDRIRNIIDAIERCDVDAIVAVLAHDAMCAGAR
jgi:RNA polymerase sigma-70 factor (ECF subfamily)